MEGRREDSCDLQKALSLRLAARVAYLRRAIRGLTDEKLMRLAARIGEELITISLERRQGAYHLVIDNRSYQVDVARIDANLYSLIIDGKVYEVSIARDQDKRQVVIGGEAFQIWLEEERRRRASARGVDLGSSGRKVIKAQMPGKVVRTLVSAGDQVKHNQGLLVIEAMKMQNEIRAPKSGQVLELGVKEGDTVNAGDTLAVIE